MIIFFLSENCIIFLSSWINKFANGTVVWGLLQQSTIDWVAYKQQKIISDNSEGSNSQDQGANMVGSWWDLLPGCRLFVVSSLGRESREEASCLMTLIRALIPFTETPSACTHPILITFCRPYLLMPSHWRVGFQHVNFGDTQIFSP